MNLRRVPEAPLLYSIPGRDISYGVGYGCLLATALGLSTLCHSLSAGDSITMPVVCLAVGLLPPWLLWTWRVSFCAEYVFSGLWVWRRCYAMSSAMTYAEIGRVELEKVNRADSRLQLFPREPSYPISVTTIHTARLQAILVLLSQRVDKSAFNETALKLLETGQLE